MVTGTSEDDQPPIAPIRSTRRRRIALGVALILMLALVALWLARKPIAEGFIDRTFAGAGVPARYGIADLGLGRQRLTNVVIGDPRAPDLVADWIETRTTVGLDGPAMRGVRAGRVRLQGRLVDGRVSLGVIDRLLPPPSGKPFVLPAIDLDIADGRMRLEAPQGVVGIKLSGRGRLDDGFAGRLAAISERIEIGPCAADRVVATVGVRIAKSSPTLAGPVRVASIACGSTMIARLASDIDVTLSAALDHWRGTARLAGGAVKAAAAKAGEVRGTIDGAGNALAMAGAIDLTARDVTTAEGRARAVTVAGDYRVGGVSTFGGQVRLGGASLPAARLAGWTRWSRSAAGTPVGPLAVALGDAVSRLGSGFAAEGAIGLRVSRTGRGVVRLSRLTMAGANGARVALDGGRGVVAGLESHDLLIDTALATSGGGLPEARVTLTQASAGDPIRGTAQMAPYAAGGARLEMTPIRFSAADDGATRIATRVTLSGPLGDGRVEALTLPIEAAWDGRLRLTVNETCAPLGFARLAVSGLTLSPGTTRLCPVGGAMLRLDGARLGGGVSLGATRLAGSLGTTPVTLAANEATVRLADRRFGLRGVAARIGAADRATMMDIESLDGVMSGGALSGTLAGGAGRIGTVPLLLSKVGGTWRFAGGVLSLDGALDVADAGTTARFRSLAAKGVGLTLSNGVIRAVGTLREPTKDMKVADVTIDHALGSGSGSATLRVATLAFTENFQPELLTPLTFGVIADVRGTISGEGRIAWSQAGVSSTGSFRTDGTDLAAAFGPVTGIAGEIRFTDLLALQSAPGQVVTIKTLNPGIPVSDGVIRYQTYPDARVLVESGRWPFAGGALTLDATLLDFSQAAERRMTFRVDGAAADQFLQQFDFKNVDATGTFDGVLPMIFDESGGRIEGGKLAVRAGGGSLAYVGDLTQKDLGLWGNIAFQALKSLRYRNLGIVMNGPLAGEMVTEVKFAGISQGEGAKSNFLIRRLQRLPFVFNIRIKAPFRGLLDSAQSFYDPKRLIQRNLPQLLDEQNKRAAPPSTAPVPFIQPPASETVP